MLQGTRQERLSASRNLWGSRSPGHTELLVRPAHLLPLSHTCLEGDLLFWLLGRDLQPEQLGPLTLLGLWDCRDMGTSPSSRKSSVRRADFPERAVRARQSLQSHH